MFTQFRLFSLLRRVMFVTLLFLGGAVFSVQARSGESFSAVPDPTAALVNPDGTLNLQSGFRGPLDLSNWQVTLDPQHGPLLAPLASDWSGLSYGVGGTGVAILVDGSDVYVGGGFYTLCGNETCNGGNPIQVNNIARWDGTAWHPLGNGLSGVVYSLAMGTGGELYAGGDFFEICGDPYCIDNNTLTHYIARWDGSAWSPLNYGLNHNVYTVAVAPNGDLYAGGYFSEICDDLLCNVRSPANHIARWSGSTWSPVNFGVDDSVWGLAFSGNNLIVGGQFHEVCGNQNCDSGTRVNFVAQWDGNAWNPLGNGFSNSVYTFAIQGSRIVAGGYFDKACGNIDCDTDNVYINHVAEWDGISWTAVGNGVDASVRALTFSPDGNLFAGGSFEELCGSAFCGGNVAANYVAQWNGNGWNTLDDGLNNMVYDVAIGGIGLVAVGSFSEACGNSTCDNGNVPMWGVAQIPINTPITWNNPAGGSWGTATNWTPQEVPGSGDESVFNLEATYDVTVGPRDSGRSRIENGSVAFRNANLTLLGPLTVGGDATFTLPEGTLDVGELIIGSLPPTDPLNPPTAHVFISNQGTQITGDTAITVGDASNGDLFVSDAKLTSGAVAIGANSPGAAVLSGQHGEWTTQSIVIGAGYTATLDIEHGGYLHSGDAVIGQGDETAEYPATVRVDNAGSPLPAFGVNWQANVLTLGGNLPGELLIENGGAVAAFGLFQAGMTAHPGLPGTQFDAVLDIEGAGTESTNSSRFYASEDMLLGVGDGARVVVSVLHGGKLDVLGNLSLGFETGSQATMTVAGFSANGARATVDVGTVDGSEVCYVGFKGSGSLLVRAGGVVTCSYMRVGVLSGSTGYLLVSGEEQGASSTLNAGLLCIGGNTTCDSGQETNVQGTLEIDESANVVITRGTVVGNGGRIIGRGEITPGELGLGVLDGGYVDPGVSQATNLLWGHSLIATPQAPQLVDPGTLVINGSLTLSPTASLVLDVIGTNSSQYDQLVVNDAVGLNGRLQLQFSNGFAPQQGDVFTFIQSDSISGAFNEVTLTGLAPGFEYTLSTTNGVITLTALNDGVPTTPVEQLIYLPLIVR